MDIDISRWVAILSIFLLAPGLLFLVIVVLYVTFAKKKQPAVPPVAPDPVTVDVPPPPAPDDALPSTHP